ncbi:MAG: adenylate/guanylate cyclase domain-containing protein [Verrucomicrobia bacterium]|nr:MAG: adenylate/guanylate cyclase domain-containing protein [Verrucomicrobiota bacterium]
MEETLLSHRLVAVWFADIVGYSARAAEDETGALRLVEILQTFSRETVRRYGGRVVKFIGDAVLAEFPSTDLAVRAAVALNIEYADKSITSGGVHRLRIGVHVGDVAVGADGDLYGDAVNVAARIQEAAEPGQVVLSRDVWQQLRNRRDFQFQSLGDRSLKGIAPTTLYVVTLAENAAKPTPPGIARAKQTPEERKKAIRSVAVLPFADLSAEGDQEYFCDGVAEEILNALAKVGGLHVPARTSCFAFRGASVDARVIGERLGVEAFLEGSIRKARNRVRIIVQLVDARHGDHLWSERFDRELEDIFAIQDEIAHSVITGLGLSLTSREERRLLTSSTENVQAYEFYLRGRKLFQKWTRQNIEFARQMFERAIKLDPGFAGAWAGLATAHVHLFSWRGREPDLDNARKASSRALELDPELAEAHVAAGQGLSMEQRYAEAAVEFERAIELDPALFDAYYYYARSCFKAGDLENALRLFRQAQSVRPEDYQSCALMSLVLRQLGRRDEARGADQIALASVTRHLDLNPDDARAYSLGAGVLGRLGDVERAKQWSEQALSLASDDDAVIYNAACALAVLGESDRALDALELAIDAGLTGGDWVPRDPDWERLRNHPRFQALAKRLSPS